eukprot:CAMPEP_0201946950 /NCGR_PEP_ID=MMETSP0903-20130614/54686_1 /ASSEMBLY_ACC=CAM_ASM_000552 /TAXON_ID=420261 /ORGANISM="Thalassiosira antarctica, Strain CCMP982" /LENGTH=474 /DNA_ID=CAMNT_0048490069 /DNA_START=37 /DNA_END=1458 /DNA_ORIENTATION=+
MVKTSRMHAHIDAFSGAAGDMLLAACLDAADSLPRPLQLGQSPADGDDDDGHARKNSEKLLSQLVHDLEGGLPELKGEFELTVKRVWRGMGRIAAKKVDVESVYNHEAAPVPGANVTEEKHSHEHKHEHHEAAPVPGANVTEEKHSHEHKHEHRHDHHHQHSSSGSNIDDEEGVKEDPVNHGDTHDHSHAHAHNHNNSHAHNHGHSHDHSNSHDHDHGHQSGSKLRNLPQIKQMLQSAPSHHIPPHVASLAIEAFTALAHAEMHTHGAESIDQVHFHEVGAVDSIVDTVGTLLALYHLGVDLGDGGDGKGVAVTCSPLPLGEGTVWTDHGLLPVPAPATMRLMIGMPTCPGPKGVTGELVTPTAAALLRVLTGVSSGRDVENNGSYWQTKGVPGRPPSMIPRAVGVGAGTKDFERHPNVLRLILGDNLQRHSGDAVETGEKTGDSGVEGNTQETNNDTTEVSESSVDVSMTKAK